MNIYHYIKLNNIVDMVSSGGLKTRRRFSRDPKNDFFDKACLYFFLDKNASNWSNNNEFTDAYKVLFDELGELLLEVEINENDKDAFVADFGYIENFERGCNIKNDKFSSNSFEESQNKYTKSLIPLKEYLLKKDHIDYSLPQVVVFHDIKLENIKISKDQELLEKYIFYDKKFYLIDRIKAIHSSNLSNWLNNKLKEDKDLLKEYELYEKHKESFNDLLDLR